MIVGHTGSHRSINPLRMKIGNQTKDVRILPLSWRHKRWAFGGLTLWLALFPMLVAWSQPIEIDLKASGAGSVETPCPRPYQIGQGYVARAIPGVGARFLRWEDGSTNPERYRVLDSGNTHWVAHFETIVPRPFLEEFGLDALDPAYTARVGLVMEGDEIGWSSLCPERWHSASSLRPIWRRCPSSRYPLRSPFRAIWIGIRPPA